eukprot:Gb_01537 [translate_table: standard]
MLRAKLVDLALSSGKIFEEEGFKYIKECFDNGTLHLIGLLSDGGVHSRIDQLQLLLKGTAKHGAKRVRVHILTDGRDCLDGSSISFVEQLEKDLADLRHQGVDAQIASGGGRMYVTMDRYENDWGVVKRGWDAHVLGEAPHKFRNALQAIKKLREDPKANDQYLPPFVIVDENENAVGPILDGDAVVTFNFRADRMIMLAKALEYEDFDKFDRIRYPKIHYAGMLQYDGELKLPSHYLVSPPEIERTSGEYLIHNGIRTFACRPVITEINQLERHHRDPKHPTIPMTPEASSTLGSRRIRGWLKKRHGRHFPAAIMSNCLFDVSIFLVENANDKGSKHEHSDPILEKITAGVFWGGF